MNSSPQVLEAIDEDGRGFRVTFSWQGDRFGHTINWTDGDEFVCLLTSEEGTDVDQWPASPPFQEVSIEPRNDGSQVALLVGMAGKSHWSASIEAQPEEVVFDVACRVSSLPKSLGTSYAVAVDTAPASEEELQLGRVAVFDADLATLSREKLDATRAGVQVVPLANNDQLPRTVRWKYRIRRVESA